MSSEIKQLEHKFAGYIDEMVRMNRRGRHDVDGASAPDQFIHVATRSESTLDAVVGGQDEHNIPAGQPEPTSSGVV